jgi:signal peptidase II
MSRVVGVAVAATVILADQVTKAIVERSLQPYAVVPVIPHFFNLTRTHNPGAAFGLFSDSPSPWKATLLAVISAALILMLIVAVGRSRHLDAKAGVGLSLILGGALSNLFDRLAHGRVVDFLDFYWRSYHWFTFNLADSAIVAGAGLLLLRAIAAD